LVVPFFACEAPACHMQGKRNGHLQVNRSTEFGTSPPKEARAITG
jgi:hypothetical protein